MYLIENKKLIECKNKALKTWSKHNFIFKKFSSLVIQKTLELKNDFNNILLISSDYNETISEVAKLNYKNLFYLSQYKSFLENFSLEGKKIIKVCSSFEENSFKEEVFDLVICNFCFHNINKKKKYLQMLNRILTQDGLLICNYFGENSLIELKNSFMLTDEKVFGGSFLRFPKSVTLVEFSQMLIQEGFKEVVTEKINYEIFYKDVLTLLKDIRGMGESGFHSFEKERLKVNYYKKLNEIYKQNYIDENSKLKVSCEIISSSSWKGQS